MDLEALKKITSLMRTNRVLSEPTRLSIMILLFLNIRMKFTELQKILNLTPGNLSSHLKKLDEQGYIKIIKGFVQLKPATLIEITEKGANKLKIFMKDLKIVLEILDKSTP
ncbi:MAG: transcriptional regulator [Candidatus Njordarchaeales archaeon]